MRRIVVGVAALLLVGGSVLAWTSQACACSRVGPFRLSNVVHVDQGWSIGLVTVTAGGGQVRTNPRGVETSVKVAPTSWVGTVPSTLWVTDEGAPHPIKRLLRMESSSARSSVAAFRPGTQWVVRVQNADAWMGSFRLLVVGNTVQVPKGNIIDDVDGADPTVVDLDALRAMARRD
jgi:hypothetical protein